MVSALPDLMSCEIEFCGSKVRYAAVNSRLCAEFPAERKRRAGKIKKRHFFLKILTSHRRLRFTSEVRKVIILSETTHTSGRPTGQAMELASFARSLAVANT